MSDKWIIPNPQLNRLVSKLQEALQPIQKISDRIVEQSVELKKGLTEISNAAKLFESSGWLPHHTTPFREVHNWKGDTEEFRSWLGDYYRSNWANVRPAIESKVENYLIDHEAKETFNEALDANEAGFYRSVCRLLPPEIERVSRIEIHGDRLERITSQRELTELAGSLTSAEMEPSGYYGFMLYKRLAQHLYQDISDDTVRTKFAEDPIPNRHAVVHGLISYSTHQNSLNSIFMTDFIFQVISYLKQP